MKHIKGHYEIVQTCKVCGEQCQNLREYKLHMKEVHETGLSEINTCVVCFATFQYEVLYKLHVRKAHDAADLKSERTKERYIKEKLGGMPLSSDAWSILTNPVEEYKCDICDKVLKTRRAMKDHKSSYHTAPERQCPICGGLFRKLDWHIKTHSEPTKCEICGQIFKNQSSVRGHMRYAHPTKDYPCKGCGQLFRNSSTRMSHTRLNHLGKLECGECGRSFINKSCLQRHIEAVHLELRKYKCLYCEKTFKRKDYLKLHVDKNH